MSRMLRIVHRLHYTFGLPRHDVVAALCLCPLDGERQRLLHHSITASPEPTLQLLGGDAFGNSVAEVMWESMQELTITSMSTVELTLSGERLSGVDPTPFLVSTPYAPVSAEFRMMGEHILGPDGINASSLFRFAKLMRACLRFDERWARTRRPAADALRDGEGTHADYAHIALAVLRSLGHAACYISGYLLPPSGAGTARPHAWIAVHTNSHGWLEVDPMLGCPPDLRHVAIAVGGDCADVTPVEGEGLTCGLYRVRSTLSAYPLTRTSIPVLRAEPDAIAS